MPTPVGHSLSGALVYSLFPEHKNDRLKIFLVTVFLSVAPDLDFVFGFIAGRPNLYHHQFTHSIVFVLAMSMIALLFFVKKKAGLWKLGLLFVCAGLSHLGLDMLAVDKQEPYGMQLFWPFVKNYYMAPVALFPDVWRSTQSSQFFQSLFNWHNLRTLVIELVLLGPLTVWSCWHRIHSRLKKGDTV